MNSHPERVPEKFCDPFRVEKYGPLDPGVCASLRPPATFYQPSGLKNSNRTMTDESCMLMPLKRFTFNRRQLVTGLKPVLMRTLPLKALQERCDAYPGNLDFVNAARDCRFP